MRVREYRLKDYLRKYGITLFGNTSVEVQNYIKQTEPFAILKPWRRLGAGWIDDYVCRRKNVTLCDFCSGKYGDWWKPYEYRSDWVGWLTNCDGCRNLVRCNMYYPEETIRQVLHPRYWKR